MFSWALVYLRAVYVVLRVIQYLRVFHVVVTVFTSYGVDGQASFAERAGKRAMCVGAGVGAGVGAIATGDAAGSGAD